jgi:hypothetical protein
MAQTGFTPIQLYSSSTATNVPLAANLATGELAINITDGKLFYKDNANAVQVIGWKVVPATAGGTGQTSYAVGDLLYADTTTTLAKLADVATGNALISGGVGVAPAWGKIGLTTHISGVLPVANGGTNASTASITSFNNITGYSASGATGTTTTNLVFSTSPTLTTPTINTAASVGGTWTAAATWTLPAFTLGGTVSGGGNQINNVIIGTTTPAAGTFTTLKFSNTTLASYEWTPWNPSDILGTVTNAPATGTADDSDFVTMANASGTLTITFDVAGKYFICITEQTNHAQVYSSDRITANLGGTATKRITYNPTNSGVDANDANFSIGTGFYVSATAAQTLTILPTYELVGGGTAAQHTAACNVTIQYCGG